MSKVIVAGSIITDMSVMVEQHPQIGETVIGDSLKYSAGGKGANQAVSAAQLGASTVMMGRIGSDSFGQMSKEYLNNKGAYADIVYSDKPTGIAMIQVSKETGNNSIVVILGANEDFIPSDIDHNMDTDIEHGDILVSQFEIPLDTVKHFFQKGKEVGTLNILNPAPAQINDSVKEILQLTDILIVNETELEVILGKKFPNGIWKSYDEVLKGVNEFKRKDQIVIVTLGFQGCIGYIGNIVIRIDGIKVKAIDTTGAGDCFVGAIAAYASKNGIRTHSDLEKAMTFANKAASLSVQKKGSGSSMPSLSEVEETEVV